METISGQMQPRAGAGRARGTRLRSVRRRRERRLHPGRDVATCACRSSTTSSLPLDDYEGVDITRLTRELTPEEPYGLNLMRITVDGEPIDDPDRSSSDVQRCTDVALDKANIQFRFDNLESRRAARRRGDVPPRWRSIDAGDERLAASSRCASGCTQLRAASSSVAEVRIFDPEQSRAGRRRSRPRDRCATGSREWQPDANMFAGAGARAQVRAARLRCARATSTRPVRSRSGWSIATANAVAAASESPAEPPDRPIRAGEGSQSAQADQDEQPGSSEEASAPARPLTRARKRAPDQVSAQQRAGDPEQDRQLLRRLRRERPGASATFRSAAAR